MKVTVKDFPVRYKGKRYAQGEKLDIDAKAFDEKLFEKEETKSAKNQEDK